jgi:hypothetical protein
MNTEDFKTAREKIGGYGDPETPEQTVPKLGEATSTSSTQCLKRKHKPTRYR